MTFRQLAAQHLFRTFNLSIEHFLPAFVFVRNVKLQGSQSQHAAIFGTQGTRALFGGREGGWVEWRGEVPGEEVPLRILTHTHQQVTCQGWCKKGKRCQHQKRTQPGTNKTRANRSQLGCKDQKHGLSQRVSCLHEDQESGYRSHHLICTGT